MDKKLREYTVTSQSFDRYTLKSEIFQKVLKKIKPTKIQNDFLKKEVNNFILNLKETAKNLKLDCDFFLGGSFGKNTYLKGNFDVDIFCRFNTKYEDKKLSIFLKNILNKLKIKSKKEKGSRDYYKIILEKKKIKIIFELVPIRKIIKNSDALNSTDFSPFHVEFLKENIKKNKNLCDEIRLAKQFFKAHNLYGAESYIGGFSGHVIDILIIHYKSLSNLLKEAKNWKETFFLDINNFYKNEKIAMKKITIDKISNLIIVDPILKNRNAARAVSSQKYFEFLFIANQFSKFSKKDFIIKRISIKDEIIKAKKFAKKNNLNFLIYLFNFTNKNDSDDIIGSKLLKIYKKISIYFEELDFNIFNKDFKINFDENKCSFIYFFENIEISNLKKIKGPKVFMKEAVFKFLKKNIKNFYIEDERVFIYKKRKITKLNKISNFKLKDLKKFSEKDLKFIKTLKIVK